MKFTDIGVATLAATLFTGSAIANSDELSRDLVNESVKTDPASFQACDRPDYDPRGKMRYTLDQAENTAPASPHTPYERVENGRDNSQNLIDMRS